MSEDVRDYSGYRLAVIAGWGSYPRLIVEGAKRAGVGFVEVVSIAGSTDRATRRAADAVYPTKLCRVAETVREIGRRGYHGVVMAGQINPLSLFRGGFGREVQGWLDSLEVKTAHTIFTFLIGKIEEAGAKVLPASVFMDGYLPGVGPLTKRGFTAEEEADAAHAAEVVRDIGRHDVGQTVMVKRGMVLAVEAFEGTNRAIRRGGRLGGKGSVVFKAARVGHDMRFDIPVIGIRTLKVMARSGVTALAFQSGRTILLDRDEAIAFADRHDIALVGVDSGLPTAPLRP